MTQKQFGLENYSFRPSWLGALILLICVPLFVKLGLWQYHKATLKQAIQAEYTSNVDEVLANLPNQDDDFTAIQYKKVRIQGSYDAQYQILLDNQVEESQAGFHVITPLKLAGRDDYVLINRGWIASGAKRDDIPAFTTPNEVVEVVGQIWLPNSKIFTLESESEQSKPSKIWQHLDIARYQKTMPIKVLPMIIKLDENSKAGGFVRHWQMPPSKIATHLGYAYQWFGFAGASILIYLFSSLKKRNESV